MTTVRRIATCTAAMFVALMLSGAANAGSASQVQTISAPDLAQLLEKPRGILLLDVREREEYAVSHIPGALHVSPSIDWELLARRLARVVSGKVVVLYCTLGTRSTDLTIFANDELERLGAKSALVLAGGIIGWHNEQRVLVDRKGATQHIHAYRLELLELVKRKDLVLLPVPR